MFHHVHASAVQLTDAQVKHETSYEIGISFQGHGFYQITKPLH